MPEQIVQAAANPKQYALLFLYAVAAISGAAGGCLVAAQHVLRNRRMTTVFVLAYSFVGMIFGLVGVIITAVFTAVALDFERVLLLGLIFGAVGSSTLAGMNLSARILLRRLGIEIDVKVHKTRGRNEPES